MTENETKTGKLLSVFIIAGEASGDALGGKLMKAMRAKSERPLSFHGIGGIRMQAEGLQSLFPMHEIAIMGFAEIVPHIPHMLQRIKQTVETIQRLKPDVVVTIDAPGFNFRVAKALQGSGITLIHYVAPTVWAYKPQRAEKVAALFDQLIVLLPFEPPYFEKVGIPCTYVGHPVVEETVTGGDPLRFRKTHNIPKEAPLLCLLPGSRKGEIHRHLPVYSKTMSILKKQFPDLHCLVVTPPDIADYILDETKMWPVPLVVSSRLEDKAAAYAASNIALVKSGTAALELSLAEVPMIVTYRVNPISAWMLRRMLKVKCVNIVNLISGKQIIPELLQEECRPPKLAEAVSGLLRYEDMCEKQVAESREALTQLGLGTPPTPSERAAEVVLNAVK